MSALVPAARTLVLHVISRLLGNIMPEIQRFWKLVLLATGSGSSRLTHLAVCFALQTHAMPQFQVQQAPDAIVVVAMLGPMFVEEPVNGLAPKISTLQTPRFKQYLPDRL